MVATASRPCHRWWDPADGPRRPFRAHEVRS